MYGTLGHTMTQQVISLNMVNLKIKNEIQIK